MYFNHFILLLQMVFQLAGVLILFFSSLTAIVQYVLLQPWQLDKKMIRGIELVRVAFGQKIVFSLEFLIVADAIATVSRPSMEELYRLGIIVAIRTALSFFISKELKVMTK